MDAMPTTAVSASRRAGAVICEAARDLNRVAVRSKLPLARMVATMLAS